MQKRGRVTNKAPVEASLGLRLREAREYLGLSRDEVAQHLGVSRSSLSLMEDGTRNASAVELSRLAKLYKTTVESLAGHAASDDESIKVIVRVTATLSDKDKEEMIRFTQYLRARSASEPA